MNMNFYDKNGMQITAGMHLRFADGSTEKVYDCIDSFGNPCLGINASNDAYMQAHDIPECEREFYPLTNFNLREVEICEPELTETTLGQISPV